MKTQIFWNSWWNFGALLIKCITTVMNSRLNAFAHGDDWSLDDSPQLRLLCNTENAHPTCRRWGKWLSIRILHTPYASFNVLLSPKMCCQVTSSQIQVHTKSLALYGQNYGKALKIWCFVTLTELVTARLHKRSFSTFGNLDRMLDWIYIEFAMVIHCWVLLWVLVRRWKSVKAPVVKAGTKSKREEKKERDFNSQRAVESTTYLY